MSLNNKNFSSLLSFQATRVALVSVLPIALTACGGGGGGGGSETPPPTSINNYTVSTEAGEGGDISPSTREVPEGSTTTFTLQPDQYKQVATASGCNGSLSGNTYTTGPINSDCTVSASFEQATYTISTQVNGGGSISPDSVTLDPLQTTQFEVNADNRWELASVSGCSGSLEGNIYTTGEAESDCTVTANFSEFSTNEATIPVERIENVAGLDFEEPAQSGSRIVISVVEKTQGLIVFDETLSDYDYSFQSKGLISLKGEENTLHFNASFVSQEELITGRVYAEKETEEGTSSVSQSVHIKILPNNNEVEVADGFCFEGYCNGEEPQEVTHNLFNDDRVYTAHFVAVAPAETTIDYQVNEALGKVVNLSVRNNSLRSRIKYDVDYEAQTLTIHNPYNYNDEPLITFRMEASNGEGEVSTETINLMYYNAYASARFTNFDDSNVALPKQGSRTFDVSPKNFGSAGTTDIYIRDYDMMIPSIVATVDENDTCDTDEDGNARLDTCDLIQMSVDQETDQVTITTQLESLLAANRDTFSSGLQLYPYIVVCVEPTEEFEAEDCQDLYIAGMNAFISDISAEEAAKIAELEALMPRVSAFLEYNIAIQELVNMLSVQGVISNTQREEYLNIIRSLSAPIVQEVNIANQYILNINGNSVSGLQEQSNSVETTISNIEYYLEYDDREAEKFALYNQIIEENNLEEQFGLLQSSPVMIGDDGSPSRFAYNQAYGEMVDGEFVFDSEYQTLQIAVQKSKR